MLINDLSASGFTISRNLQISEVMRYIFNDRDWRGQGSLHKEMTQEVSFRITISDGEA